MLRIALFGASEEARREIERRLLRAAFVEESIEDFDVAIILRLKDFEFSRIEKLLSAQKHVALVPDRMLTRERVEQLTTIAGSGQARLMVASAEHARPAHQLIQQKLSSLGQIGFVRIHCWHSTSESTQSLRDSDCLLSQLRYCCQIMDSVPNLVFAVEGEQIASPSRQYLQIHLGFSGGPMALIDIYSGLPEQQNYQSLSIIAANGAAYSDDHQNMQLLYKGNSPQAVLVPSGRDSFAPLVQDIVDTLAEPDSCCGVESWMRTLNVHDAVLRSLASHQASALGSY